MPRTKHTAMNCKIGTIPARVFIDGRTKRMEPGVVIRVRDDDPGSKWYLVRVNRIVDSIEPGFFFAEQM
jgi:hypothetical protein